MIIGLAGSARRERAIRFASSAFVHLLSGATGQCDALSLLFFGSSPSESRPSQADDDDDDDGGGGASFGQQEWTRVLGLLAPP